MQYNIVTPGVSATSYIEITPNQSLFGTGESPNDLLSLAWDNEGCGLLIPASALAPVFFDLKTGIAGEVMQKLTTYSCRAAIVVPDLQARPERIRELAFDMKRHTSVRFYQDKPRAVSWLTANNESA